MANPPVQTAHVMFDPGRYSIFSKCIPQRLDMLRIRFKTSGGCGYGNRATNVVQCQNLAGVARKERRVSTTVGFLFPKYARNNPLDGVFPALKVISVPGIHVD
jgi:hypothetical protein